MSDGVPEGAGPDFSTTEGTGVADGPAIVRLSALNCRLSPRNWSFVEDNRARIEANWREFLAKSPASFDGRVFLQHRWRIENGVYHAEYLETRYSAFIGWRDMGNPGPPMRNGFAMAALKSRDGAYLLGIMGEGTANPGRIYFAAGTPDPADLLPDGTIDLAGSVLRELSEETGLRPEEVTVGENWLAVIDGWRAAFMRPVTLDLDAEEARDLILKRLTSLPEEELAGIHIARSPADIDRIRMPQFQIAYLEHAFGVKR
jgi:8-oxo-dGTP pyrophosphatase MutT (NUDIX family)